MKKDQLEQAVRDLWTTTKIPLTLPNLEQHTGMPRQKLQKRLDELLLDGSLEMDSDDQGEIQITMPGSSRPADGPANLSEHDRLAALKASVESEFAHKQAIKKRLEDEAKARRERELAEIGALENLDSDGEDKKDDSSIFNRLRDKYVTADNAATAMAIANDANKELKKRPGDGKKSIRVSGALSTAFGPLGWLYAGSFREAIPAGAAFALLVYLLPWFLWFPILPLSGIAGLVYAWQHNQDGKRTTLLLHDKDKKPK